MTWAYCVVAAIGLSFFGFGGSNKYDQGYESAWEGEEEPSSWASRDLKEGYEDGLNDADAYDEGYYDGANEHGPKYLDDPFYMDGFKDGKDD